MKIARAGVYRRDRMSRVRERRRMKSLNFPKKAGTKIRGDKDFTVERRRIKCGTSFPTEGRSLRKAPSEEVNFASEECLLDLHGGCAYWSTSH